MNKIYFTFLFLLLNLSLSAQEKAFLQFTQLTWSDAEDLREVIAQVDLEKYAEWKNLTFTRSGRFLDQISIQNKAGKIWIIDDAHLLKFISLLESTKPKKENKFYLTTQGNGLQYSCEKTILVTKCFQIFLTKNEK